MERPIGIKSAAGLFTFLALALGAGDSRAGETGQVVSTAPARAVDVFDDSFLLETPPPLADVPEPIPVFREDFEASRLDSLWKVVGRHSTRRPSRETEDVPAARGTPLEKVSVAGAAPPPPATVEVVFQRAHGGRQCLKVAAEAAAALPRLERVIAVRPRATHRLTAFVRTEDLAPKDRHGVGASVEIAELGRADGAPIVAHQHLPRERGTSAGWKKLSYTFRTSETTRHLRIVLKPATGRASGAAFFDDLSLVEVPRIVHHLESDRFSSQTRRVAPHPLVKRLEVQINDYRPAVLAPAPTRWRWSVRGAADTLLRFELGLLPEAAGPAEACFLVRWHGEGAGPGPLFDRCLLLAQPGTQQEWHEVALDLGPYAGRQGELRFETRGPEGTLALWGNPRLVARQRRPGDERPDIVLLVFDTLRPDHLGIEGYHRPTSPVLDELARGSVRFSRAYSPSPWTAPSMASIFTGRYPSQHHGGIRIERELRQRRPHKHGEGEGPRGWQDRLLGELFERATALQYHAIDAGVPTLAERLRAAGYATFGFHANFNSGGAVGLSRGFDRYVMFSGVSRDGARTGVELARGVLASRREQGEEGPFLLMLHTQDAHIPYRLRRSQADTFGPSPVELDNPPQNGAFRPVGGWGVEFWDWGRLRAGRARRELEHVVRFYDSEIAWADRAMADLLQELDARPDTVVAVTADHGEEFGDHGQFEHGHSLYNELLRVPLFVRLPEGRHGGTVVGEPVSTLDVAPTLLHLAGAEPLPGAEGRSLFAVGGRARARPREGFFAEAMLRGPERTAYFEGRFKYILTHPLGYLTPFNREVTLQDGLTENAGREELYDLEVDPAEKDDLALRQPETAARLRQRVLDYLAETAHGIHFRCRSSGDLELEVAATETFAHVQPLRLDNDDTIEIAASRRGLIFRSRGGAREVDWWVLRLFAPGARLSIRAESAAGRTRFFTGGEGEAAAERSLSIEAGDPRLLAVPGEIPGGDGPWCRLWQVAGGSPASSEALDSEIVDQLRALGYL